jgi:membrane-bound lytic murein transglycosylase B
MKQLRYLLLTVLISLSHISPALAASENTPKQQFITMMVKKYDFDRSKLEQLLQQAHYQGQVIEDIKKPYEAKPWYQYKGLFVNQQHITGGLHYYQQHLALLQDELDRYGVPPQIVVAILGIESKYGHNQGTFNELDALTTLAFHYPPRAAFFQAQLAAYLRFAKQYHLNPRYLHGSYAGAMGQPQFMPSNILQYGISNHAGHFPNLFNNVENIILSIGNFLKHKGWQPHQPIAMAAKVEGKQFSQKLQKNLNQTKAPQFTLKQWQKYGVKPVGNTPAAAQLKANLIRLQGKQQPKYWLVFHNFYVLMHYNPNAQYAMAVFQLAQALKTKQQDHGQ